MAEKQSLLLGVVADDFTGASDAASFIAGAGLSTVLVNGLPEGDADLGGFQAVVIALKSRTQQTEAAVADSLAAFDHLRAMGASTLYFKYCSTFDSTPRGNIGPVIDAAMERYDIGYTLICPSLPVNGRTVLGGVLYAGGVPLAESHMKNHPLTPMWASDLTELMRPQGRYPCHKLTLAQLASDDLPRVIAQRTASGRCYLCPDYVEDAHGAMIAKVFPGLPLYTGGSGLAGALARQLSGGSASAEYEIPLTGAPRLILAGSCSDATRGQVACYLTTGKPALMLDPAKIATGEQGVPALLAFIEAHRGGDILLYSSGSAGPVEKIHQAAAELLEQTFAQVAREAAGNGYSRIVVAGGETSGAVTQALGYRSFHIGRSAAPGVPMMVPTGNTHMVLALKSGNFGGADFFLTALREVRG